MNKRLIGIGLLICGIALGAVFLTQNQTQDTSSEPAISLASQSKVANYTHVTVRPAQILKGQDVIFEISLESYQNPDILDANIPDAVQLSSDGEDLEVKTWKVQEKTDAKLTGRLTFQGLTKIPEQLTFTFLDEEDVVISWDITQDNDTQ